MVRRLNKRTTRETSEYVVANVLINKYVYDINAHEKRIKTHEIKISNVNIFGVLCQGELQN